MTKKEIVKKISEELNRREEAEAKRRPTGEPPRPRVTQLLVKEIVQMVFDSIVETLMRKGRIELRNFGVFEVKTRKARTARNPRTGDAVAVPAKSVVIFKPGKTMEERVLQRPADANPPETPDDAISPTDGSSTPAPPTHTQPAHTHASTTTEPDATPANGSSPVSPRETAGDPPNDRTPFPNS